MTGFDLSFFGKDRLCEGQQKDAQIGFRPVDMQFSADIGSVKIDRPGADVQYARDLLAGLSGFDQVRHLDLHGGQFCVDR